MWSVSGTCINKTLPGYIYSVLANTFDFMVIRFRISPSCVLCTLAAPLYVALCRCFSSCGWGMFLTSYLLCSKPIQF